MKIGMNAIANTLKYNILKVLGSGGYCVVGEVRKDDFFFNIHLYLNTYKLK